MKDEHPHQQVEVWVQDEARFGQQGTLTRKWAPKGSRPTAVKQTEYEWLYLFGAVNPVTGESVGLMAPTVNTDLMNAHLQMISKQVRGNDNARHVVLVLDQAGWHVANALRVPDNITLLYLPPYSPELNPIERLWLYLREHYLSNRVFKNEDELWAVCCEAWNRIEPERFASVCRLEWWRGN